MSKNMIEILKADLRALLIEGYKNGGSLEHGDKVRALKARIAVELEERKFFA